MSCKSLLVNWYLKKKLTRLFKCKKIKRFFFKERKEVDCYNMGLKYCRCMYIYSDQSKFSVLNKIRFSSTFVFRITVETSALWLLQQGLFDLCLITFCAILLSIVSHNWRASVWVAILLAGMKYSVSKIVSKN